LYTPLVYAVNNLKPAGNYMYLPL